MQTLFGETGLGRLRFVTPNGVRYTARTYSVDARGGTFGALMPPLNAFQIATAGETLEILGAVIDDRFRTNIGIVELNNWRVSAYADARITIIGSAGELLDSFDVEIPIGCGIQIDNVFRNRGIAGNGKPVLIRVQTLSGVLGAYATLNDNGTKIRCSCRRNLRLPINNTCVMLLHHIDYLGDGGRPR